MQTANGSVLRMSLADIARAAHVERPVVSMWRKRTNRAGVAFPQPVGERDGHPEFDLRAVSDFLAATELGNNPDVGEDLVAFARPAGDLALNAPAEVVTALLTVAACSGDLIRDLDGDDLMAYAAQLDPDDVCLRREIETAVPVSPVLADYVDGLLDAAYSARAALEVVAREGVRRVGGDHRRSVLATAATQLVASIAVAVARATAVSDVSRFVDPTPGDGRLLAAVADVSEGDSVEFGVPEFDCRATRLARCRLLVRDTAPGQVSTVDGELDLGSAGVVVCALPPASEPTMSVQRMLDTLNDITLAMSPHHWGVVLAPSAVLIDKLSVEPERARDNIIRDGRLRLAARLPAGLAVHQGQSHLALWVFGPATRDVPPEQRGTVVADLSDAELTASVIDELATDAVTSLSPVGLARRVHAFHRSTMIPAARLLSGSTSLVAEASPSPRTAAADADRIEQLRQVVGAAGHGWSAYATPSAVPSNSPSVTIGRAVRADWIRLLPGQRISVTAARNQETGAPIIGPDEVAGRALWGAQRIGLLELTVAYPNARLTEPGDVVFATVGGEVVAAVDRDGGSVVHSPARVLRVRGGPPGAVLTPHVIAADLRAQPASARRVESWPLRLVPQDVAEGLQSRAAMLATAEARLRSQLGAVAELRTMLIDGVVSGTVTLSGDDVQTKSETVQDHSLDKDGLR